MASHHQSPSNAMHQHHTQQYPPQHVQPNGHPPPFQSQPPPQAQSQPQPQPQPHARPAMEQLAKTNEDTWVQLGRAAETLSNSRVAIESYHRALQFNQYNIDALRQIASIYRAEDKYDQAVEYIKNIIKVYPNDGEAHSSLGHCYLMMDELQQAYSAYQSALYNLRDPKEPKLWYGIGILYDRYGSLDHAEEAFSQVMRMQPDFEKANEIYFRLGIIYKQQSKFDQSLGCFQYIVGNPPKPLNQTDIWFQIGHVYEQQKEYESAKNAYLKVLERDPQHAKVLQQLGWLHHQQSTDYNSQEQAIEYLEKSVSSDQTDAQSWYLLGRCYMSQHKFPKAYEAYQQAVYREGRNPTFWCSIGVLYYQINQYRDALDAYSRAIRLNPNISEVWYDLGTLYESCNNQTSDALDAYQRAAELDPQNQQIKARVQLLRSGQSSGAANQHGAPLPQDVPAQLYQPTGASGAPQPQWGGPNHHGPPPQGPPPPPLNTGREWNHRLGEAHASAPQSHQPPLTHPHQPVNPYESRETSRGHHTSRPLSPRLEQVRHQESYAPAPAPLRRPLSPSPRSRHTVPHTQRAGQSVPPGAPPPPQQPPSNRITNPNFGGQHAPPTPSSMPASVASSHNQLPPYSRVATPPTEARPPAHDRPRSPRSAYQQHQPSQPTPAYSHHQEPNGPSNIASGAPAPSSALAMAEAAARERDQERNGGPQPPKRLREWDDREDGSANHKKMASEESRARLDDPHSTRTGPSPPSFMPLERERAETERAAERERADKERADRDLAEKERAERARAQHSAAPAARGPSDEAEKKVEEERRADENYRPSEVAHHPAPLRTVMQQDTQEAQQINGSQEAPKERQQLPPIQAGPQREGTENGVSKQEPETVSTRMEIDEPPKAPSAPPVERPEEPAARKMEVDENYDDDDSEEAKAAQTSKEAEATSGERGPEETQRGTGEAPSTSISNGMASESAKVEASA